MGLIMSDYLILAAEHLGAEIDDFLVADIRGDFMVVVVDKGIAGCPKYYIPLSELEAAAGPVEADLGVYDMSYRELQAAAKELGVPANQGRDELIAALWPEDEEE